jgi:hypothetical protein
MVWDREAKGPAGVTPEQAVKIEAALRFYYTEGRALAARIALS